MSERGPVRFVFRIASADVGAFERFARTSDLASIRAKIDSLGPHEFVYIGTLGRPLWTHATTPPLPR